MSAAAGVTIQGGVADTRVGAANQPRGFAAWFANFVVQELTPSPRRLRATLRIACITALASGLGTTLQLPDSYAPMTQWRILATGSPAMGFLEMGLLTSLLTVSEASSLVLAGILSEAPWFALAFVGAVAVVSTYVFQGLGLGSAWVMIQIGFFATFFTMALTPRETGDATAYAFAGIALAYAITYLSDNFFWPERAERDLLESLANRIERNRRHLEGSGGRLFRAGTGREDSAHAGLYDARDPSWAVRQGGQGAARFTPAAGVAERDYAGRTDPSCGHGAGVSVEGGGAARYPAEAA